MDRSVNRETFDEKVAAFIQGLDKESTTLVRLMEKVDNLGLKKDQLSKKTTTGMIAGQATLGVAGVIGICAAPFTGGVSLALAGIAIAAGVAGGGASLGVHLTNRSESEEIEKRFREIRAVFRRIIESLNTKLQDIVPPLSKLRQEYCADKQKHLIKCETRIEHSNLTTFTGDVQLPEAKEHFKKCVKELEDFKTVLKNIADKLDG